MPLEQMEAQGLAEGRVLEKAWMYQANQEIKNMTEWADVVVQQSVLGTSPLTACLKYKEFGKKVTIDFDDYPWECDPFNAFYRTLGLSEVEITDPDTGAKSKMWEDGKDGFSLKSNHIQYKSWVDLMKLCDAVTVTTPYLRNKVVETILHGPQGILNFPFHPERIRAIPNAIDFDRWKPVPGSREKWPTNEFRIGYACGASHMVDWVFINEAIFEFLRRHKDAKFVVVGDIGFDLKKRYPMDQLEEWHWADLYEGHYQFMMGSVGLDVGIAPLADKEFNRCKSNIKYLEYSAVGYPSILQNMHPYKDDIVNGENALLAGTTKEWIDALEALYQNYALRVKLRMNALATVKALYDVRNVAKEWAEVYSGLIRPVKETRRAGH